MGTWSAWARTRRRGRWATWRRACPWRATSARRQRRTASSSAWCPASRPPPPPPPTTSSTSKRVTQTETTLGKSITLVTFISVHSNIILHEQQAPKAGYHSHQVIVFNCRSDKNLSSPGLGMQSDKTDVSRYCDAVLTRFIFFCFQYHGVRRLTAFPLKPKYSVYS